MGNFDFGQFQQIFEYLMEKLAAGGALTPEEQQVFDQLMMFSNQGLNLTNTADFNSLYQAFSGLADEDTKRNFESLYGEGVIRTPEGGIQFSRPGSVIEQFMRRGLSVNDGPAMAALSEGLRNYLTQIAQNKFAAMTNSYAAMTPIRQQNINAAIGAGNVAGTAAGRRTAGIGGAIQGGIAAGGEGEGEGGGEINLPLPPGGGGGSSTWDRLLPGLLGLLGTGALAYFGPEIKKLFQRDTTSKPTEVNKGGVQGKGDLSNFPDERNFDNYTNRAERLDLNNYFNMMQKQPEMNPMGSYEDIMANQMNSNMNPYQDTWYSGGPDPYVGNYGTTGDWPGPIGGGGGGSDWAFYQPPVDVGGGGGGYWDAGAWSTPYDDYAWGNYL